MIADCALVILALCSVVQTIMLFRRRVVAYSIDGQTVVYQR